MDQPPPPNRRHSLRKSQLIDFPNVAAGHYGVKSNRSGDLIVKPCKNPEVEFYQQHWKPNPDTSEFAYHMPKFFGTLNLQDNPPAISPLLTQAQASQLASQRPDTPTSTSSSKGGHARTGSRTVISHLPVDESLAPTNPPKKWQPVHGAQIDAENGVVLENIASGLLKPNILDIKLGARLWADDAPIDKRQRLDKVAASTTSGSLGFRIAGMKIWAGDGAYEATNRDAMDQGGLTSGREGGDAAPGADARDRQAIPKPWIREDDYASYDKDYGRALTADTVRKGLEEYFYRPPATGVRNDHTREVISRFVDDLKGLQAVLEHQETRMYSASLLFVYEGSGAALREDFRRENRMFREAREARERAEAGQEEDGPTNSTNTPPTAHSTRVNAPATLTHPSGDGVPSLPQIDVGSPLEMPSQLVMTDAQMADGAADDDADSDDSEDESTRLPKIQALKMIDFAHATMAPGQGPDENVLRGLRNVISLLEAMLAGHDD